MEEFKKYLNQFPNYTPSVFENLLPHLSQKIINSGHTLLNQGKTAKEIAYIEYGLFRQFYINDEGKGITTCFCKENSITTSYKSLITQTKSDITIEAVEESKLIVISLQSIKELLETDAFWQQFGRLAAENEFI
jgi:CRP-like cAMP-binding protein